MTLVVAVALPLLAAVCPQVVTASLTAYCTPAIAFGVLALAQYERIALQ
jgi:hypothetical protein